VSTLYFLSFLSIIIIACVVRICKFKDKSNFIFGILDIGQKEEALIYQCLKTKMLLGDPHCSAKSFFCICICNKNFQFTSLFNHDANKGAKFLRLKERKSIMKITSEIMSQLIFCFYNYLFKKNVIWISLKEKEIKSR
jgi:hypothetical protein